MATTSSLPPNWNQVLDQIQTALQDAIQKAEDRETSLTTASPHSESFLPPDVLARYLDGMDTRLTKAMAPLQDLDHALQAEEDLVRKHLGELADLGQRLANWTAGAIG